MFDNNRQGFDNTWENVDNTRHDFECTILDVNNLRQVLIVAENILLISIKKFSSTMEDFLNSFQDFYIPSKILRLL